jgi:hypothetical protein
MMRRADMFSTGWALVMVLLACLEKIHRFIGSTPGERHMVIEWCFNSMYYDM